MKKLLPILLTLAFSLSVSAQDCYQKVAVEKQIPVRDAFGHIVSHKSVISYENRKVPCHTVRQQKQRSRVGFTQQRTVQVQQPVSNVTNPPINSYAPVRTNPPVQQRVIYVQRQPVQTYTPYQTQYSRRYVRTRSNTNVNFSLFGNGLPFFSYGYGWNRPFVNNGLHIPEVAAANFGGGYQYLSSFGKPIFTRSRGFCRGWW